MCASELIVNVPCQSNTVLSAKPMNKPDQPIRKYTAAASVIVGM
jgi:hypothetical protein